MRNPLTDPRPGDILTLWRGLMRWTITARTRTTVTIIEALRGKPLPALEMKLAYYRWVLKHEEATIVRLGEKENA